MLRKDFQLQFSDRKFQDSSLHLLPNCIIFTTITIETCRVTPTNDYKFTDSYNTYLCRHQKLQLFENLRILDGAVRKQGKPDYPCHSLLCSGSETRREVFRSACREFGSWRVHSAEPDLSLARMVGSNLLLKVGKGRDCLHLQHLKQNEPNCDIFGKQAKLAKQSATATENQSYLVLDLCEAGYRNQQINNLTVLGREHFLMHVGQQTENQRSNTFIAQHDLEQGSVAWKYKINRFQTLLNKAVPFSRNSFVNAAYNFEDNVSSLRLFDFRTRGPVLKVLQSNSDDVLRLSVNRNLDPKFQILCQFQNPCSFGSLLAYKGGARSIPFRVDVRQAQRLETIETHGEDYLSHVKEMQYADSKLVAIERYFSTSQGKKGRLSQYHLEQ